MVGGLGYWIFPDPDPHASIAFTTLIDSLSRTLPKTTCFPSSQLVTTVVMKNWDPLLMANISSDVGIVMLGNPRIRTSISHGENTGFGVLEFEGLVGEFLAVN